MWSAYLIVAVLIAVFAALARGMVSMLRGGRTDRTATVRALTWRIGLSVALFIALLIGFATGVLRPHGVQRDFGPVAPVQSQSQ